MLFVHSAAEVALARPISLAVILTRCGSGVSEEQADIHDKLIPVASLRWGQSWTTCELQTKLMHK